jgi:hypothetical protein
MTGKAAVSDARDDCGPVFFLIFTGGEWGCRAAGFRCISAAFAAAVRWSAPQK